MAHLTVSSHSDGASSDEEGQSRDPLLITKTQSKTQAKGAKGQQCVPISHVYVCADDLSSLTSVQ